MSSPRILIVDDEPSLLRLTEYTLRAEGYDVILADTGGKALALVEQERPDLVILDVMLPDISGQDVCRTLRQKPETADLPVIMLSARVQVADRIQGIKAGADEYVTKPVDSDELVARVEGLLRRARSPQRAAPAPRGRLLAICGARGGVGVSTVAARTSLILAQDGNSVILADLLPCFGTLAGSLGIDNGQAGPGIFEGEITADAMRRRLADHPSGLRVLTHPEDLGRYQEPNPEQVGELLETLVVNASWVILDLSGYGSGSRDLASRFDAVYVVVDPDSESIKLAARRIELLTRWGVPEKALGAVVVSRLAPLRFSAEQLDVYLRPRLGCSVVAVVQPSYELLARQHSVEDHLQVGEPDPFASSILQLSQRLAENAAV